jgi:hypothetical protein
MLFSFDVFSFKNQMEMPRCAFAQSPWPSFSCWLGQTWQWRKNTYTVYCRWFSHRHLHLVQAYSSLPCLMTGG